MREINTVTRHDDPSRIHIQANHYTNIVISRKNTRENRVSRQRRPRVGHGGEENLPVAATPLIAYFVRRPPKTTADFCRWWVAANPRGSSNPFQQRRLVVLLLLSDEVQLKGSD